MKAKNRYRKGARLDNVTTRKIIEYFSKDFTAQIISEILGIERKTINNWYNYINSLKKSIVRILPPLIILN